MILLPEPLLRSVIRFGEEDNEHLTNNLYMLRQEVEPPGIDSLILDFVGDMMDRTKTVPHVSLLRQHFTDKQNEAALSRLSNLGGEQTNELVVPAPKFLFGPEFRYALDQYKQSLMKETVGNVLLEASTIISGGWRKGRDILQGPEAAVQHLSTTLAGLNQTLKRGSIEGAFRNDASKVRRQYEHWKNNQADTVGVLTGIDKIDAHHRGLKSGELALVLGFVSHLKTTFCLNWLYKSAILFGRNSAIASLETPVDRLRLVIYVMHSNHPKFQERGLPVLDYDKVRSGSLDREEENTLDAVIEDLKDNPDGEYGEIFYKEPQDSLTIQEIGRWAEAKHKTSPLDFLVIDYLGLVDAVKGMASLDSAANLNKAIRQAKMLAMTFGSGKGIAIASPHQANREGLKEAEKNGGRYKLTALANANESERSTDIVYYCYLDDTLRNNRELVMGNLKARDNKVIQEQFKVYADPATRTIDNLEQGATSAAQLVEI